MKKIILILGLVVLTYSITRSQDTANYLTSMNSITAAECMDHVNYLASRELAGRGPCDAGFNKAADYISIFFRITGLKPLTEDSSYYQEFLLDRNVIENGNEFYVEQEMSKPSGKIASNINYILEEDFLPAGISSSCDLTTEVVFVGYGVTSPQNDWNDYKKVNVKNKVVMVLGGAPPLKDANFGTLYRVGSKVKFAEKAGAAALLVVGKPIGSISDCSSIPVINISEKVANDILERTSKNIESLKEEIKEKQRSINFPIKQNVKIKVNSEIIHDCSTMNILGYIEGSDAVLKDEFIVIGAHVDHLGKIDDHVFYGANDNASGSAVLMEIAEAFSLLKEAPKRSVLFIAFTGEEMGLIGSSYFVDNPLIPIPNMKAMINLDMVGSGDDAIMVVGGHTFPEFAQLIDTLSKQYIYVPIKRRWTSANSDHYPFHNAGIPSVFLYAMNGVQTYHSSADRPETLDPEVMENVGRLVFLTTLELANFERIEFRYMEKE